MCTKGRLEADSPMLTQQDVQQFQKDGYFIARGVFSGDELARLRELAEAIQAKTRQNLYPGTRYWFGKSGRGGEKPDRAAYPPEQQGLATWGVNELPRRELFEPELVNVWAHPKINAAMNALLDEPRAWGIKMLWAPKLVPYDLGWHRDQVPHALYDWVHHKPIRQDHIQFNAALNTDHSFLVVPGSHRRPLTEQEWAAVRKTDELPGQVVAALGPGDIVFMDAHAYHRGRCSVESDRLTLHYSAQSQWVPLKPWGHEGHMDWLMSDEFISQLAPDAQPYYTRLRTAERTDEAMGFVYEAAKAAGWEPVEVGEAERM